MNTLSDEVIPHTVLSVRTVHATAKDHQCGACLECIPAGSFSEVTALVHDGEFFAERLCGSCVDRREDGRGRLF